jgi:hypothetical protein
VSPPATSTYCRPAAPPVLLSTIGDANELAGAVTADCNAIHLILRGNMLTHTLDRRLMTVMIDDVGRPMA